MFYFIVIKIRLKIKISKNMLKYNIKFVRNFNYLWKWVNFVVITSLKSCVYSVYPFFIEQICLLCRGKLLYVWEQNIVKICDKFIKLISV